MSSETIHPKTFVHPRFIPSFIVNRYQSIFLLAIPLFFSIALSVPGQLAGNQQTNANQDAIGDLLDKPGAVQGNRPWENAWTYSSANFIVKSNISPEATREIARVMEALLHNFQKLFSASLPSKISILVPKRRSTFEKIRPVEKGVRGWFQPKRGGGRIVTYYQSGKTSKTTDVLLHEGTHMFVMLAVTNLRSPDVWVNEGLAVYFEASQFNRNNLVMGKKPRNRLLQIKRMVQKDSHTPIRKLIQKSRKQFNARDYAQAWSLVYYLLHARDHKFADRFNAYLMSFKKKPSMDPTKRFLLAFRTKFKKLESDWVQFVKSLDASKEDTVTITGER